MHLTTPVEEFDILQYYAAQKNIRKDTFDVACQEYKQYYVFHVYEAGYYLSVVEISLPIISNEMQWALKNNRTYHEADKGERGT